MSEQQPDQPTLTPQPNRILAEEADVAACRRDYDAAADVMAQQDARRN